MLAADLADLFPGHPRGSAGDWPRLVGLAGLDDGSVQRHLACRLRSYLAERTVVGYDCFVVGLSGGVDSAVCARLALDAAPGGTHCVIIDLGDADAETAAARRLASLLEIPITVLDGRAVYAAHRAVTAEHRLISRIQVRSRIITSMLFQYADNRGGIVIDTTDRSEEILSLYEEGQRGHVAPVIDLYKSELYALATALKLGTLMPSGCPDLDNHDAFGVAWPELDGILDALVTGRSVDELAKGHGLDAAWLTKLSQRVRLQPLRTQRVVFRVRQSAPDDGSPRPASSS